MQIIDELTADSPQQLRALSHPLRHRLLRELPSDGATISQLARKANTNKGNVSHHLRVLLEAGLVQRGPSRTVLSWRTIPPANWRAMTDQNEQPICSAKGCQQVAVFDLQWNNPKIHTPDRRKHWLACDQHRAQLEKYLGSRGLLKEVEPLTIT